MNYRQEVAAIKRLTKEIEKADANSNEWKWERADRIVAVIEDGHTRTEIAGDTGLHASTVGKAAQIARAWSIGSNRPAYLDAYREITGDQRDFPKRAGGDTPEAIAKEVVNRPEVAQAIAADKEAMKAFVDADPDAVEDYIFDRIHKRNLREQKEHEAKTGKTRDEDYNPQAQPVNNRTLLMFMLEAESVTERALQYGFDQEETRAAAPAVARFLRSMADSLDAAAEGATSITDDDLRALLEEGAA